MKNFPTTTTFHKNTFVFAEKQLTLKEYCQLGRIKPGQQLYLADVDSSGCTRNGKTIWIGDATPYIIPTTNDGGIGWDLNDPLMAKAVVEIYTY